VEERHDGGPRRCQADGFPPEVRLFAIAIVQLDRGRRPMTGWFRVRWPFGPGDEASLVTPEVRCHPWARSGQISDRAISRHRCAGPPPPPRPPATGGGGTG